MCACVCLLCRRVYLMIGWDRPPLRGCTGKQRVAMVTVKGEGGGCVCGVVLEVARWTLAGGRRRGERALRSGVLCHSCCSPSLCFPSLPVSRVALLLSSWSEWEAVWRTNAESQWDSWEETHFLALSLPLIVLLFFIYKPHNSARSGYYTIYQHTSCLMTWKCCKSSWISVIV